MRTALCAAAVAILVYLALIALSPRLIDTMPDRVQWFGRPNSALTIAITAAVLLAATVSVIRHRRESEGPVAIVAGLAAISLTLGLASYWDCHDGDHPRFFTTLMWTAGVVKGGTGSQSLNAGTCPSPTPVALEIARLSALAALFISLVGVAAALFRTQTDRLRVRFATSVTAVVGVDDDADSMLEAILHTCTARETPVVVTAVPDQRCVAQARRHGARVLTVDVNSMDSLTSLSLWRRLKRLYLLSPDPSANLRRLAAITQTLSTPAGRQRIPLIVRLDDPWQAMSWRAQQFGGLQSRWAADAVGRYEVTARRLLDEVLAASNVERIVVGGASQLTLAIFADIAQRQLEQDYYAGPDDSQLPTLILVAPEAEDYRSDHEFLCRQLGLSAHRPELEVVVAEPSVSELVSRIGQHDVTRTALILVDADEVSSGTGTRVAARLPTTPIWAWDPQALVTDNRLTLLGGLRTFRMTMDVPGGQAQDAWERAARLIHDRYAAEASVATAATKPWADLDEFYRGSNRRQVRNALWMVERLGGHTWNTFGSAPDDVSKSSLRSVSALEQLQCMGFDANAAQAMARAEHEDWCRYYRAAGWKYGSPRDEACKVHDNLVDWNTVEADPVRLDRALTSLAATLSKLRELGYRSRPVDVPDRWKTFRRTGIVEAEQRRDAWTWTTRAGDTMRADPDDWAVHEPGSDHSWSVRDNAFRSQYEHLEGNRWRRRGTVSARPVTEREVITTLEGPATASPGDWVVRGDHGEQWPVPAEEFERRYRSFVTG